MTQTADGEDVAAIRQLLGRIDVLTLRAWRESPFGAKTGFGQEISEEILAAALGPNEALLEFTGYVPLEERQAPRLGCFVIRPGQATRFKTLAPLEDVLDAVDAFVRGLLGDRWKNRLTPRRQAERDAVRRLVLDPLLPWLDEVGHLIVCGEGGVERLPFDLLGDAAGSYPATWTVTYAAVARDVLRRQAADGHARGAVFAAPDYAPTIAAQSAPDTTRAPSPPPELRRSARLFRDLKGSREEGELVVRLTGADLYQDQAASKGTLASVASPAFLHFATHGFYLQMTEAPGPNPVMVSLIDHPMYRCGLALAHADSFWDPGDRWSLDGIVTGAEAAQLELSGTRFAVLSACDSATGEAQIGEVAFGLHRAFLIAGAACVVACLWPVEDRAARRLIEVFYGALTNGLGVRDALFRARDARRRAGAPIADWAAFVCFGHGGVTLPASVSPPSVRSKDLFT